nr:DJ-1/PfpI family protein [Kineococcus aurantiacus]
MQIVVLLFPQVTQLDFTAPAQVFDRLPGSRVHLAWHETAPVVTDCGWSVVPTTTLTDCPPADVLFVPGGEGAFDLFEDEAALDFLRRQAATARWVTSVCTGSFALAAAGLLDGRRATSHWASLGMLAEFGVEPVSERVVVDGRVVTGAGITSGIDFALQLAALECGEDVARGVQLALEYDPAPPFDHGSARTADPETVRRARQRALDSRLARVQRAADRLTGRRGPAAP